MPSRPHCSDLAGLARHVEPDARVRLGPLELVDGAFERLFLAPLEHRGGVMCARGLQSEACAINAERRGCTCGISRITLLACARD